MIAAIHGILEQGLFFGARVLFTYVSAKMTVSNGTVTKTGAGAAWDASVRSDNVLSTGETGELVFRINVVNRFMIGFNNGNVDDNYTDIDCAMFFDPPGARVEIYKNGVFTFTAVSNTTFVVGEYFKIQASPTGFKFYRSTNGGNTWTQIADIATTTVYPLLIDSSFYATGASINEVYFKKN